MEPREIRDVFKRAEADATINLPVVESFDSEGLMRAVYFFSPKNMPNMSPYTALLVWRLLATLRELAAGWPSVPQEPSLAAEVFRQGLVAEAERQPLHGQLGEADEPGRWPR